MAKHLTKKLRHGKKSKLSKSKKNSRRHMKGGQHSRNKTNVSPKSSIPISRRPQMPLPGENRSSFTPNNLIGNPFMNGMIEQRKNKTHRESLVSDSDILPLASSSVNLTMRPLNTGNTGKTGIRSRLQTIGRRPTKVLKSLHEDSIKHMWYTNWPDHGIPEVKDLQKFTDFITYIVYDIEESRGNTVIHCSAGIGRTGVVLTILYLIFNFKLPYLTYRKKEEKKKGDNPYKRNKNTLNEGTAPRIILETIKNIRTSRPRMVQTYEQFEYIYNFFDYEVPIEQVYTDLKTQPRQTHNPCPVKNRYPDILTYSDEDTIISLNNDPINCSNYINASKMNSLIIEHTEPKIEIDIIAAQCPTKETIPDFYKMLDKYKIRRIIMVTGLVEKGKKKCDDYFNSSELEPIIPKWNAKWIAKMIVKWTKQNPNISSLPKINECLDWGEIRTLDLKKLEETN